MCTRTQRHHEDWARTAFECLSVSCGGIGQQWQWPATGVELLGAADLGMAKALLEEVAINPTIELLGRWTYTGLGKQNIWGHKQNLMWARTQEKGAVTPQDTDPDLPVSVLESLAEEWVSEGLLQGPGHWVQQCMHRTFGRRWPLSSLPPP